MMELTINIEGRSQADIEQALAEVTRLVTEGFRESADRNETGNYNFEVTGESVEEYVVATQWDKEQEGDDEAERYSCFEDARDAAHDADCAELVCLNDNGSEMERLPV